MGIDLGLCLFIILHLFIRKLLHKVILFSVTQACNFIVLH